MHINYCLKSEASIMLRCQLCSTCYTAFRIKNFSKCTYAIHAYQNKEMVPHAQLYQLSSESEVSIMLRCWLCSTHYKAVQIKNCSKCPSAIKMTTMNNTDDFCYEVKSSRATARLTPFAVSKDEWDTKEDNGKSIVCTAVCQKAPLGLKRH